MARVAVILRWLVIARLLFHVFYLPVFEGPDEPFHLGRASTFVDQGMVAGLQGDRLDLAISASIAAHPCWAGLAEQFGCPTFTGHGAEFNILGAPEAIPQDRRVENYQSHQPPLYYLSAAVVLAVSDQLAPDSEAPKKRLLTLRLLSVFLVALALFWPIRVLGQAQGAGWESAFLTFLLMPGAVESLARVANDTAVFLWCAFLVASLHQSETGGPGKILGIYVLLAIGPLIKLTALPVAVFAAFVLLKESGRWVAIKALLAAGVVMPFQLLRGWAWGGTLEMAAIGEALREPPGDIVLGVLHSVYTFIKTAFWLGGWSVFRPPFALVIALGLLLLAGAFLLAPSRSPKRLEAHLAGTLLAAAGFVAFAIGKWGVFKVWGGVGGWYLWPWAPWIAILLADLTRLRHRSKPVLILLTGGWLLVATVFWFIAANDLY